MITTRIDRLGATYGHLKWFAPVWSRFLAIKSSPVFGPGFPRVYLDAWLALAVSHKTGGSTSRIRANAWTGASRTAAMFADGRLARTSNARPERYRRAGLQVCRITRHRMPLPRTGRGGPHGRSPRSPLRAFRVRTWHGSGQDRPRHHPGQGRSPGCSRRRLPRSDQA